MKKKGRTPMEFIDEINKGRGYKFKIKIKDEFKEFYTHNKDIICHDIEYSKDKEHIYPIINGNMSCRLIANNCIITEL